MVDRTDAAGTDVEELAETRSRTVRARERRGLPPKKHTINPIRDGPCDCRPSPLPWRVRPGRMVHVDRKIVSDIGIVSTIVDAAVEFARGRPKSGAILLGAAALSRRVPGLGFAVSALLRIYRRLR